ncbi:hypothetical protein RI129_001778 [Pyrocoelia pectoralis]|uniref:Phospholipase A2 n=1 Tax=Pyrocoelia pectoralis TaxID=417401 RepID=A0AAN7W0A0_9COLE
MRLFCLFFVLLFVVTAQNVATDKRNSQDKPRITLSSSGNSNITVYFGYANNPFGPSVRFSHENVNESDSKFIQDSTSYSHVNDSDITFDIPIDIEQNSFANRRKRGVIHLYNMVNCATGCDPLIYKGYGCYCGFLGSGYPVDGIDRCCKKHDRCYDASDCPTFLEYFVPFYWKCFNNRPICAIDHDKWGGPGSCAYRICQCDRKLSECLSKYPCPSSRALCRSSSVRLLQNALMVF